MNLTMRNWVTPKSPARAAPQVACPVFRVKKSQFLKYQNLHLIATKAKTKQQRPKLKFTNKRRSKNVKFKSNISKTSVKKMDKMANKVAIWFNLNNSWNSIPCSNNSFNKIKSSYNKYNCFVTKSKLSKNLLRTCKSWWISCLIEISNSYRTNKFVRLNQITGHFSDVPRNVSYGWQHVSKLL